MIRPNGRESGPNDVSEDEPEQGGENGSVGRVRKTVCRRSPSENLGFGAVPRVTKIWELPGGVQYVSSSVSDGSGGSGDTERRREGTVEDVGEDTD